MSHEDELSSAKPADAREVEPLAEPKAEPAPGPEANPKVVVPNKSFGDTVKESKIGKLISGAWNAFTGTLKATNNGLTRFAEKKHDFASKSPLHRKIITGLAFASLTIVGFISHHLGNRSGYTDGLKDGQKVGLVAEHKAEDALAAEEKLKNATVQAAENQTRSADTNIAAQLIVAETVQASRETVKENGGEGAEIAGAMLRRIKDFATIGNFTEAFNKQAAADEHSKTAAPRK